MTETAPFVTNPDEFRQQSDNDDNDDDESVHSHESAPPDRTLLPHTMYVVFDLETTGFSKEIDQIVEIAAQILTPLGDAYGGSFSSLINPLKKLSYYSKQVTGLTDEELSTQPLFHEVATDFFKYITSTIKQYEQDNTVEMKRIVFVAHNGITFDFPFLFKKIKNSGLDVLSKMINKVYVLDTRNLAKEIVNKKNGSTGKIYSRCVI